MIKLEEKAIDFRCKAFKYVGISYPSLDAMGECL